MENKSYCPLLTMMPCEKGLCAWWCGDKCAVVLFALNTNKSTANIAESLELSKKSFKAQEEQAQIMEKRWEEIK